jgi:hypothetical protein
MIGSSSTTYPNRRKSQYACLYYYFCGPTLHLKDVIGPIMGLHVYRNLTICGNSPFNGLPYAKLKVAALYRHEHKGNYAPTECIGCHFDKISTQLIILVHPYRTEVKVDVKCLKGSSLSKRTNGGCPLRLAK